MGCVLRVAVLVEGQTEETFVKEILADHLSRYHIFPYATRVCTKRVSNCRRHRGGVDSYSNIKTDIQILRRDSNITAITTMFDFYAFPQMPLDMLHCQMEMDMYKLNILKSK